jgi:hypothetical protein
MQLVNILDEFGDTPTGLCIFVVVVETDDPNLVMAQQAANLAQANYAPTNYLSAPWTLKVVGVPINTDVADVLMTHNEANWHRPDHAWRLDDYAEVSLDYATIRVFPGAEINVRWVFEAKRDSMTFTTRRLILPLEIE